MICMRVAGERKQKKDRMTITKLKE